MDRIYEAYMGEMGESFAQKTQKRIHWICDNVQGENILDVGCSQGIISILLARNGKKVTGLDISEETIACANSYLAEETEEVRNRVVFKQADFGCFTSDVRYDTIIMGEVLEHLLHPQVFLENAWKQLNDHGTLVVTVPFGINDDPDHKQTFYYFELHQMLEQYFHVSATVYFGKWIGFIAHKDEVSPIFAPSYAECLQLEQAFYKVERDFINTLQQEKETQNAQTELLRDKLKKTEENYQTAKEWVKNKDIKIETITKDYETRLADMNQQIANISREKESLAADLTRQIEALSQEKEALLGQLTQLKNALVSSDKVFAGEERFLLEMKAEIERLTEQLAAAQDNVNRIDEVLYNTWYGRLAWAAYRFLRKIKRAIFKN